MMIFDFCLNYFEYNDKKIKTIEFNVKEFKVIKLEK